MKAGHKEEVEFELGENAKDKLITGNAFNLALENGIILICRKQVIVMNTEEMRRAKKFGPNF